MGLRPISKAIVVGLLWVLTLPPVWPGTWVEGYFYQVTALKGQVVGSESVVARQMRWLRQSFTQKDANLTRYQYCSLCGLDQMVIVKTVKTNKDGKFDFGPLKEGRYKLTIRPAGWDGEDSLALQVKDMPKATDSVTLDVSPNSPDCPGGHEFLVSTK